MAKLIIMRGLPASGKSTRAKKILRQDGNSVRVNKDELRLMLHGDRKWSGKQEGVTNKVQKSMVMDALELGKNVVVDDTNLGTRHYDKWWQVAKDWGHKFELEDLTDVPVEECLDRDFYREKWVGRDVILNMAHQYGIVEQEKNVVIFDLDGTLADITERREKSLRADGSMNWSEFFDPNNVWLDKPRVEIFDMLNKVLHDDRCEVNIVSGRSDITRHDTECWLREYGVDLLDSEHTQRCQHRFPWWNRLIMRQENDHRPDDELKLWFLDRFLDASKVQYVVDDRPRVIRAWESRGLEVVDVGPGVEF